MSYFLSLSTKFKAMQGVRFVLIGLLNTAFSYLIYAAFLFFGLGYQLANFLALVVGILFSFRMQGYFVFDNPDTRLLGRFVLSWGVIYLCTITVIGQIIALGFDPYSAGALSLPFSVALSYLLQKYFVFRHKPKIDAQIDHV